MEKIELPTSKLARCAILRYYKKLRNKLSRKEARNFLFERFNLKTGQPLPDFYFY